MATNKDKIRASAQKYLQKGQIDKAIREFQRLVEEDPKDVRTLLKIGDLQTRIGANADATKTYGQVALFYSEQGFFLKAVAVYKQILKLDPSLIDVNLKLADLYHQLGLMSDAANQYRQISALYEKDGRVDDAIKVLRKMVDVDPDNVASRIKLAEMYAKQNMGGEARAEFSRAAQFLKQHHRVDDYVKVAERIIHFDPNDLLVTKELANIYIQKGDARRALAKLQVCFKANPKDVETLNLLAVAFRDLGQVPKTVSVYRELARIHRANGDDEGYRGAMRKILALAPDDAEAQAAVAESGKSALGKIVPAQKAVPMAPVRELDSRPPEDDIEVDTDDEPVAAPPPRTTPAPAPPPAVASAPRVTSPPPAARAPAAPQAAADGDAVSRVLIEAEVYVKYGLKAKALEHIRKVFDLDPHHREARARYKTLLLETGATEEAADVLFAMAQRALERQQEQVARDDLEELVGLSPNHKQARELLATLAPKAAQVGEDDDFAVDTDDLDDAHVPAVVLQGTSTVSLSYEPSPAAAEIDLDADDEELVVAAESDDVEVEVEVDSDEVVGNAESEELIVGADSDEELPINDSGLLGDEDEPLHVEPPVAPSKLAAAAPAPIQAAPSQAAPPSPAAPVVNAPPPRAPTPPPAAQAAPAAAPARKSSPLDAELEALIGSAVPPRKTPAAKPAAPVAPSAAPAPAAQATTAAPPTPVAEAPASAPAPAFADLSSEIEEVRFYLEQGLEDEARDNVATLLAANPGHPELLALSAQLNPPAAEPAKAAAPAHEAEPEPELQIGEIDLASELGADLEIAASDDDFQASFSDVFEEFKKGVAKQVEESDHDTHYNLGIAYKEMGLVDDAIREFELAARDPQKEIGALTMMGICALQSGNMEDALTYFLQGLNSTQVTPKEAVALRFEIGAAYESSGQFAEAAKFYDKVRAMDATFRDVEERLESVRAQIGESSSESSSELDQLLTETEAEKAAARGKISYV